MRYILLLLCCFSQWLNSFAQTDSLYTLSQDLTYDNFNFYVYPQVGVPLAELRGAVNNKMGDLGLGFTTGFTINPFYNKRPSPVFVGAEFGYLAYGVDKIPKSGDTPPVKTTYNIYNLNAVGRVLLTQRSGFVPFVDGTVGMKIFNTRTKIDEDLLETVLDEDQTVILNKTNDTGLNYSAGVGFYYRKKIKKIDETSASFSVRFMYVWGDEANYVKRNSITVTPDLFVSYETGYTRTDMIMIQVGIMVF